jgi:DNA-binding PadR family transcriptional regulator
VNPIDFNGLDTTVHGPLRLGVLTALQLDGPHDFTTLKKRLEAADGSLGLQLLKLEEAGYVRADKALVGRRPRTTYHLTPTGRAALARYLDTLQQLLAAMGRPAATGGRPRNAKGCIGSPPCDRERTIGGNSS